MATTSEPAAAPVSLFYSYAHEDGLLREELQGHLKVLERRGLLAPWHDRQIVPGTDWAAEIDRHLESAELVLLLVSKDFIESDYIIGVEMKAAMRRHEQRLATVVPIVVRAVDIEPEDADAFPFMKLQGLPTDLKPVTSWAIRDEAWTDVAKGLRATVKAIRARRPGAAPLAPAAAESPTLTGGGVVRAPAAPAAARPVVPAAAKPDPLLDRVVEAVAGQIGAAQAQREGRPLDPGALRILHDQTRMLIDMPDWQRVLWVDDHPEGNLHEAAALAKLQIEITAVRSTDAALAALGGGEAYDLVISDWERDGEARDAGLRLLGAVRALHLPVPFVFYHAAGGAQRAERAAQARAAGAFGEAVLPAELIALVTRALAGAAVPP